MYLRAAHAETSIPVLRQLIRDHPLGILTTAIPHPEYPLLQCSHIPWVLDVQDEGSETELGRLRGHMARANPQAKAMVEEALAHPSSSSASASTSASASASPSTSAPAPAPTMTLQQQVLVLFTATPHHYVSPRFYAETKPATGKVVPTWDYAAVQVYGRATLHGETSFLDGQMGDLTRECEEGLLAAQLRQRKRKQQQQQQKCASGDQDQGPVSVKPEDNDDDNDDGGEAWKVSDAPAGYIKVLQRAVVGVEIEIERLEGKFKMSQEMGLGDRRGVVEGLEGLGEGVATDLARMVKERGGLGDDDGAAAAAAAASSSKS
ncbi:hypothetical protein BS50DRAFT_639615 [Corynespora cassiicola Philippines]|uniref:Transcriptional regulator n=1 Tax=Corynespora cassiicola Philippines TaxID=1448308 RepID=A0A2T2N685_CORCC|nr:hypothetical protein BS50DRAFT_639615 [Corynespora cassiicola Philippines]